MAKVFDIVNGLVNYTGFPEEEIRKIVSIYDGKYKKYYIDKASGGKRLILHPPRPIKVLQYALISGFISQFPVHEIACAYVRGKKSPLRMQALAHSRYKYTLRIDFKDFFPSIRPRDLHHYTNKYYIVSDECFALAVQILFYKRNGCTAFLPIGAPSSPLLSNVLMFDIDDHLYKAARRIDPDCCLTRYADDVYFSSNISGASHDFLTQSEKILSTSEFPKISINNKKTLFLSRGTRRVISGLVVTPDGRVSIGRCRKLKIKKMIHDHERSGLSIEDCQKAKGMLSFIRDVEPSYYNLLAAKFGDSLFRF